MTAGTNVEPILDHSQIRKTAIIDSELSRRHIDIAAFPETRLAGAGIMGKANFTFFWFGKTLNEPRNYDTGFAAATRLISSCQNPFAVSNRISALKLNTKQDSFLVISAYAPTLDGVVEIKDVFYNLVEDIIRKVSPLSVTLVFEAVKNHARIPVCRYFIFI